MTTAYSTITDLPGYRFGTDGSAWTSWKLAPCKGRGTKAYIGNSWTKLKPGTEKKTGYQCVVLRQNGRRRHLRLHVLILRAFVGDKPKGMMCCHRDDNPQNNAITNLRWDTQLSNSADAIVNGRTTAGERNRHAKLTAADVVTIRKRIAAGEKTSVIAADYKMHKNHISSIGRGLFWKTLDRPKP